MKNYIFLFIFVITFISYFYIIQCNGSSETAANNTTTTSAFSSTSNLTNQTVSSGITTTTAPILTVSHDGWKHLTCSGSGCHTLPVITVTYTHTATLPYECATCHGGNGACDPNGGTYQSHWSGKDCISCHKPGYIYGEGHGYTSNPPCVACHYASSGIVDCTP